jgi:hypothetical protein
VKAPASSPPDFKHTFNNIKHYRINKMSVAEMIGYLESLGLIVKRVENYPNTLHVDAGNRADLPDCLWHVKGWYLSTCGAGRVYMWSL